MGKFMRFDSKRSSSLSPPVALTIAGSDSSGGAGIQADLKTMNRLGVYGCSALTCVVAEHPREVRRIDALPKEAVRDQIEVTTEAFPPVAVKTGMLFNRGIILVVAEVLRPWAGRVPLVVDPVMVSTSGHPLLEKAALKALREKIFPQAFCITPNRDEAARLLDRPVDSLERMEAAARALFAETGAACLVKGGHGRGSEAVDVLFDGKMLTRLSSARVSGVETHGTGCTFSAALTAYLARGYSLVVAAKRAKAFIYRAVRDHHQFGDFTPLNQILRGK